MRGSTDMKEEIESIEAELEKKQRVLDKINELSRDSIRYCAKAINMMHNRKFDEAASLLARSKALISDIKRITSDGNLLLMPSQEFAEASVLYDITKDAEQHSMPSYKELGISPEAYLLGIMDVVGELKREILDSLRASEVERAKSHLTLMEGIYDATRAIRFPESVLPGFRKKQDVARIQLENAGSDILRFTK
ncbi:MAG: hypothetical protein M1603_00740 [Candidatus Marsarchaeota archaeon]|nr:hypothetical protein [Candidatus Marsarchaeota archaeon]